MSSRHRRLSVDDVGVCGTGVLMSSRCIDRSQLLAGKPLAVVARRDAYVVEDEACAAMQIMSVKVTTVY